MIGDALVVIAALDVRRRPNHRSELRSQLLMGESVRVLRLDRRGMWAWIENRSDRYRGWARTWGLRSVTPAENRAWIRRARWRVVVPHEVVRDERTGAPLTPVFWNSPIVRLQAGRRTRVELPDGRIGRVSRDALRSDTRALPLGRLIAGFRGVPYLWGGRTPLGFDCSGFVQQVLAARGIRMPRDAHEQLEACAVLGAKTRPRPGDLVFFGPRSGRIAHVGILISANRFAHARGAVVTNSLEPSNPKYDRGLASMVRAMGRPRGRSR